MNHADLQRAIDASQARALALMNDLAALHARMPDKGVDPPPDELLLLAAIAAEHAEAQRLDTLLRVHGQRRAWLRIAGMILLAFAVIGATFVLLAR